MASRASKSRSFSITRTWDQSVQLTCGDRCEKIDDGMMCWGEKENGGREGIDDGDATIPIPSYSRHSEGFN